MATKKKAKKTPAKKAQTKKASSSAKKKPAKKPAPAAQKKKAKKQAASAKTPAKKSTKKSPAKTQTAQNKKKTATTTKKKKKKKKQASTKRAGAKVTGTRHEPSVFLLVHLPTSLSPMERFEKFEEPIDDALRATGDDDGFGLGEVTGGGSSLDDGGNVVSCDIEVEVHDVARCLPILRRVLRESGAPAGTVVTRLAPDGAFEVLDQL